MSKKDTKKGGTYVNKNLLESVMKLHGDTGGMLAEYLHIALEDFPTSKNYKYEQLAASHILPHYGIEYDYKEAIR